MSAKFYHAQEAAMQACVNPACTVRHNHAMYQVEYARKEAAELLESLAAMSQRIKALEAEVEWWKAYNA